MRRSMWFMLLCLVVSTVRVSQAATGDLLKTVTLPAEAQCIGTSVGIVPGSLVGFPSIPILLVTSCYFGDQLFYVDPSTSMLVKTVTSTPVPAGGWGSWWSTPGERGSPSG